MQAEKHSEAGCIWSDISGMRKAGGFLVRSREVTRNDLDSRKKSLREVGALNSSPPSGPGIRLVYKLGIHEAPGALQSNETSTRRRGPGSYQSQ